ncbi:MAG TPA: RNA methyltransferase [Micropepsaceae bacterium]|nr:RNA methyltransferase [Micropepsaceae bacterium]
MNSALIPPAIILSEPQLGENIGASARAMANFGLFDLRLVAPRDGWPNPKAEAMAANAAHLIASARIYGSVREAVGDLHTVYATTGRDRSMAKAILTPAQAALKLREASASGVKTGILFGNERAGLANDEVALADCVVMIPTEPGFASINLGQAVLLLSYEWFKSGDTTPPERIDHGIATPAPREELVRLFEHLEEELEKGGFLFPPGNRPGMIRNLRNMLHRAQLTDQEVRTLRGVIVALTQGKRRDPWPPKEE